MKKCLLFLASFFCLTISYSQVVLLFNGYSQPTNTRVSLQRIEIENKSKGWKETLNYPDTIAVLTQGSGIEEESAMSFTLNQNVPNPFEGSSSVSLCMPEAGQVELEMYELSGKKVSGYSAYFSAGKHLFRISVKSPQTYMLTAHTTQQIVSIKMISTGSGSENEISYEGVQHVNMNLKKNIYRAFDYGDLMSYKGYIMMDGEELGSDVVEKQQISSEIIDLDFDLRLPCPGEQKTVTDIDGNIYNTIQIGNQCWMKENLRTTKYADGTPIDQGNSTSTTMAYWYYPNININEYESNKAIYGLMYNWKAMMRNASTSSANPSGVQGICPTGWHVPSDAEWTQLSDYLSSKSEYVCKSNIVNIAKALASTTGWTTATRTCAIGNGQESNNTTGFGALPAGDFSGSFGDYTIFWSATETEFDSRRSFTRTLYYADANFREEYQAKFVGVSVRCLRD